MATDGEMLESGGSADDRRWSLESGERVRMARDEGMSLESGGRADGRRWGNVFRVRR